MERPPTARIERLGEDPFVAALHADALMHWGMFKGAELFVDSLTDSRAPAGEWRLKSRGRDHVIDQVGSQQLKLTRFLQRSTQRPSG